MSQGERKSGFFHRFWKGLEQIAVALDETEASLLARRVDWLERDFAQLRLEMKVTSPSQGAEHREV